MMPIRAATQPLQPESPAHVALTAARRLLVLGEDAGAFNAFSRAADIPGVDLASLYEGCAQALRNLGHIKESLHMLDAGLKDFPGHASLRFLRSLLLLGNGQFREGWQEYEMRLLTPQRCYLPRAVNWPRWRGSLNTFNRSRLLFWSEQGFGDEIIFTSLIPDLIASHKITLECSRDTAPLFRRSLPAARIFPVELNGAMPEALAGETFDFECPLASIPLALGMDRPDPCRPWLKTDPQLTDDLRADLEATAKGRRIVGISWRGGTQMTRGVSRSVALSQLAPILALHEKILFCAIQHDMTLAELQSVPEEIASYPHLVRQLDSLAALIGACDEIVTVCNTNVHLAGAQGKRVRVLAPHVPEWRYLFKGETMPWYQNVRVYRQPRYGEWGELVEFVAASLAANA